MIGMITSHKGIRVEDLSVSMYLNASITSTDDVGKPVSVDPSADFTVGFVADADILGVLQSFEHRVLEGGIKVGAVCPLICFKFEYSGTAPTRGGRVVGDGTGKVKAAGAGAGLNTVVTKVDSTAKTVEVMLK